MEIRKNDEFELTIEDMSEDGAGIGKQDGYIWFVKDAVIGDRIRVCPSDGGAGSIQRPRDAGMPGRKTVRRLPASDDEL